MEGINIVVFAPIPRIKNIGTDIIRSYRLVTLKVLPVFLNIFPALLIKQGHTSFHALTGKDSLIVWIISNIVKCIVGEINQ